MKSILRVLDSSGDTAISFDTSTGEGMKEAEEALRRIKGGSLFNVKPGTNETSKRINSLAEAEEEVIGVPLRVGG